VHRQYGHGHAASRRRQARDQTVCTARVVVPLQNESEKEGGHVAPTVGMPVAKLRVPLPAGPTPDMAAGAAARTHKWCQRAPHTDPGEAVAS
jgi:hypothetical protein